VVSPIILNSELFLSFWIIFFSPFFQHMWWLLLHQTANSVYEKRNEIWIWGKSIVKMLVIQILKLKTFEKKKNWTPKKKLTQTTKLCFDLLQFYKHIDMNQSKCKIFFNDKYKQHIFSYSLNPKHIKNNQIFLVKKKEFGNFIRGENTLMPNRSCFMYLDVCKLCSNLMEKVVALK
jgi:hypothetical protein